jgi:excisionase family DNA binding protein
MKNEIILEKLDRIEKLIRLSQDKPMRIDEAAAFTGLTKSTLYQLVFKKQIPHSKPTSKMLFFSKIDLVNWINKHRVHTGEEFEEEYRTHGRIRWLEELRKSHQ